jgi:hypothetical protein
MRRIDDVFKCVLLIPDFAQCASTKTTKSRRPNRNLDSKNKEKKRKTGRERKKNTRESDRVRGSLRETVQSGMGGMGKNDASQQKRDKKFR